MSDNKQQMPPMWERIKNLANASSDVLSNMLKNGEIFADNEIQEERMLICSDKSKCDKLTSNLYCSSCGCKMAIKWKLEVNLCPLKKWPR